MLVLLVLQAPETVLTPIASANKVEGAEGEGWANAFAWPRKRKENRVL